MLCVVSSVSLVTNLNADLLDGKHASDFSLGEHNHTLDSLSNVTITSNATGEILKWNGTAWINNTLAEAGISATGHTHSYVPTGRTVTAGNGMTGGGELSGNITLTMGTPSSISSSSTNSVTSTSHTHAITGFSLDDHTHSDYIPFHNNEIDDLNSAMDEAFLWDRYVLVEKGIKAREIEFSVLGNDDPIVSMPGEIKPKHEFYSYEAKYIDPNGADLIIPAEIETDLAKEISLAALKGFKALNCSGMARIDFFIDIVSGNFYLNEINTIPGFTRISMYPSLWGVSGISYSELLEKLIALSLERRNEKNKLRTEF